MLFVCGCLSVALTDRSTQQQVILQARSAAPMMKMEGVFWQGGTLIYHSLQGVISWEFYFSGAYTERQ